MILDRTGGQLTHRTNMSIFFHWSYWDNLCRVTYKLTANYWRQISADAHYLTPLNICSIIWGGPKLKGVDFFLKVPLKIILDKNKTRKKWKDGSKLKGSQN